MYVGERKGKFADIIDKNDDINDIKTIFAGKFRRYHGESWIRRLTDVKTILLNIRDLCYFVIGIIQSIWLIRVQKPDVVFLKGGFVGVPIGLASAIWRIPIVTHDSDAIPGLANRIIGRWARIHATAMPSEFYAYSKDRVRHVGVLVGHEYLPVNSEKKEHYRKTLQLPLDAKILMITGGSSGAEKINKILAQTVDSLFINNPKLFIIHQTGKGKDIIYDGYKHPHLQVFAMLKPMYMYSGAADLIVTRAGANTLAEFGVQGKACIVVPSPHLSGGHQLKNAKYLEEQGAACVLQESDMSDNNFLSVVEKLLNNPKACIEYARNLQAITITDAASKLAGILLEEARHDS